MLDVRKVELEVLIDLPLRIEGARLYGREIVGRVRAGISEEAEEDAAWLSMVGRRFDLLLKIEEEDDLTFSTGAGLSATGFPRGER